MKDKHQIFKRVLVIFVALFSLMFEALFFGLFSFSDSPYSGTKKLIDSTIDFGVGEIGNNTISPTGEVDFYYGTWVMSQPDEKKTPIPFYFGRPWTGLKLEDGNILSGEGYGSYQFHFKSLTPGTSIRVHKKDYGASVRVYFDTELCYSWGVLSTMSEYDINSGENTSFKPYSVPKSGFVTVTVEVGNNAHGGLQNAVQFEIGASSGRSSSIREAIIFFSVGILLGAILTSLFFVFANVNHRYFAVILSLSITLLLYLFTSSDGALLLMRFDIYPDFFFFEAIHHLLIVTFLVLFLALLKYSDVYFLTKNKAKIYSLSFMISMFLSVVLDFTSLAVLSKLVLIIPAVVLLFHLIFNRTKYSGSNVLFIIIYAIMIGSGISEFEVSILSGSIVFDSCLAFQEIIISLLLLTFFISQYFQLQKTKKENEMMYREKVKIKEDTLKGEIQPHYLFNTLSAIKSAYHSDENKGQKILSLFSENIRNSFDSMKKDLVPFEDEIETIERYVELENLRREKKFNLILDIDFVDFYVPPLSLEPIVENSINYSRVNEKEDGFIEIASYYDDENVVITISDNGIGFDPKFVRVESLGQRNLKERLQLHLNATIQVESQPGKGCVTTIRFPYQEVEE